VQYVKGCVNGLFFLCWLVYVSVGYLMQTQWYWGANSEIPFRLEILCMQTHCKLPVFVTLNML